MRNRTGHRLYLEGKVNIWLKPLLLDIIKEKPDKVIDYVINWCETKGYQFEKEEQNQQQYSKTQKIEKENFDYIRDKKELDLLEQKINQQQQKSQTIELQNNSYNTQKTDESEEDNDEEVQKLIQQRQKQKSKKKMGISAEAYGQYNKLGNFKPRVIEKTDIQKAMIKNILSNNFMFSNLDPKNQDIVVNAMEIKNYNQNDKVIQQGDDGNELYIVNEGELKCTKLFPGNQEETYLKTYFKGEVFGELSLLYNTPRAASIQSIGISELFCLDRDTFNNIVKSSAIATREKYETFLKKIEIFKQLDPYERSKISDALVTKTFQQDQYIIREGEQGDEFFLIMEGEAVATKIIEGEEKVVFEYKNQDGNDYFGEKALLEKSSRNASIKVISQSMTVACMDGNSFERMLGPIQDILKRNFDKYENYIIKQFNI